MLLRCGIPLKVALNSEIQLLFFIYHKNNILFVQLYLRGCGNLPFWNKQSQNLKITLLKAHERFHLPLNYQNKPLWEWVGFRKFQCPLAEDEASCFVQCQQLNCTNLSYTWLSNTDFSDFSLFDSPMYKNAQIVLPLLAAFACFGCCTYRWRSGKKWWIYRKTVLHSPYPARNAKQEATSSPEAESVEKLQTVPLIFKWKFCKLGHL